MSLNKQILFAEDDIEDRLLFKKACERSGINLYDFVQNGEELMDYLLDKTNLTPGLILIDLNMPKIDGKESLKLIRNNPQLKHIPIVIFSTSNNEDDISSSYSLGANAYIVKPNDFNKLVDIVELLKKYWFETVKLP